MDYSPLWNTVRKGLKTSRFVTIGSAEVADTLGADRVSRTELVNTAFHGLPANALHDFRNVTGEYSWELHIWLDGDTR